MEQNIFFWNARTFSQALAQVHLPSLLLINLVIMATLALCLLIMAKTNSGNGLGFWALALLCDCGVYLLSVLVAPKSWATALPNMLLVIALSCMLRGLQQLQKIRGKPLWIWLPVLLAPWLYALLAAEPLLKCLAFVLLFGLQLVQLTAAVLAHWPQTPGRGKFLLLAGICLAVLALLLEIQTLVSAAADVIPPQVFLLASMSMVVSSLAITVMAHERDIAANQQLASMDMLTGLHNRRYAEQALEQQIAQAQRQQQPLAVLLLDIDCFKRINDAYGHPCGDQVLRDFSACLNSSRRAGDLLARWGGEEFIILLPATDATGAHTLAERIRSRVANHCRIQQQPNSQLVTVSIGLHAPAALDSATAQSMLAAADRALYRAKNSGRNRVEQV